MSEEVTQTLAGLQTAREVLSALMLSGGVGGLVRAIIENTRTANLVTLPFSQRTLALGWVGDALIGGCAAIVGYTFFNVLSPAAGQPAAPETVRLVGFGIAAGYAGARILNAMLDKFPQQQVDRLSAQQDALRLLQEGKYANAAREFRKLLSSDPNDLRSKSNLALALSYTGEDGLKEALTLLDEVLKVAPDNDEAWYNTACMRAIASFRSFSDGEVLEALRKALELNADWKPYVQKDPDFNRFRRAVSAEYRALTGDEASAPLPES